MHKLPSLLLLTLFLSFSVHAEFYKWTDSSGKVHYSDQKPTDGKAQTVEGAKAAPTPAAAATPNENTKAGPKSLADKELEFNKRRKEAKEATAKKEKEEADAKEQKENCDRARAMLESLQRGDRMASTDEKGERVVMDDKARQQETVRAQKEVGHWCK